MAKIETSVSESVYQIKNWLGVNEAPEGDARLKHGEASEMRNFKITSGGALQKRGGSRDVAGLMQEYIVHSGPDSETLITETGYSGAAFSLYPRATTDSTGTPIAAGTPVTGDYDNQYAGYYYDHDGTLYQMDGCTYTPDRQISGTAPTAYTGTASSFDIHIFVLAFDTPPVFHDGQWEQTGGYIADINDAAPTVSGVTKWSFNQSRYLISTENGSPVVNFTTSNTAPTIDEMLEEASATGKYVYATKSGGWVDIYSGFRYEMTWVFRQCSSYEWKFFPTYSVGNGADSEVRGIWSGFVAGREVLCTACNGHLWELSNVDGAWSKVSCGTLDTSESVHMFGFDEKLYILNGSEYNVWDGTTLTNVTGYRPMVAREVLPAGGGTSLEQVNKLTGARRCRFSPDGKATVFQLPETGLTSVDYVWATSTGESLTYTADLAAGTITFSPAPAAGVDSIEVGWTYPVNYADTVRAMRYAELYNGAQDTRVFLYGDGSNQCFYSGLDYNGQPRADYFPDLNVAHIGDANTPITAMIRHYNKLLAFKLDSSYSMYYDTLTQEDGKTIPGFYITTVNRDIGNCAPGQARLVENRPRTLDGRSVIEWRATSTSGNITGDQRNAQRVSQRVERSIRTFDLTTARTFYDKISHEYYVIGSEGTALVNNVEADAWYVYTGLNATCMITYEDEVYYGTTDGWLRHLSNEYTDDQGAAIDAYWESGAMAFGEDFKRKYSAMLWVGIKPENNGYLKVTAETDRKTDFAEYSFSTDSAEAVPEMNRIKMKAKKFTYYKLILANNTADTTATVVSADIRVRGTGYVR